jgi:hypothetical protein
MHFKFPFLAGLLRWLIAPSPMFSRPFRFLDADRTALQTIQREQSEGKATREC